jgi:pimeloyl-ACP methyl ester carboxylesterase
VLIGHSQGGIIVSMVLDILADDMTITDEQLAHVRCVITFGSAADEFHHPLRRRHPAADAAARHHDQLEGARPTHIEHFANAHDLVAQLGVLQFFGPAQEEARHHRHDGYDRDGEREKPGRRPYAGRLFVAERKGHLFNTSYSLHEEDYQQPAGGDGQRPFFFQLVNRSISEADLVAD